MMLITKFLSLSEIFASKNKRSYSKSSDLFTGDRVNEPQRYETYWRQYEEIGYDLPIAIVADGKEKENLFADTATYYPEFSPISAHVHIISRSKLHLLETNPNQEFSKSLFSKRLWIALIITEATSNASANGEDYNISFSLCKRTLAYSLARANYISKDYNFDDIIDRWLKLRSISKLDYQTKVIAAIIWISKLVFQNGDLEKNNRIEDEFTNNLALLIKDPKRDFGQYLTKIYSGIGDQILDLTGNFDGRMYALENIISIIRNQKHSNEVDSIAIGYFCNLLLPGSFSYLKLLSKYSKDYPAAIVWYGFFTSLSELFDYKSVHSGVGQKLIRDISHRGFFDNAPTSDISLDELLVLSRIELKSGALNPIQPRLLLVSLVPGLDVFSRPPYEIESTEISPNSRSDIRRDFNSKAIERDKKMLSLLSEIQKLILGENTFDTASSSTKTPSRVSKKPPRKQ